MPDALPKKPFYYKAWFWIVLVLLVIIIGSPTRNRPSEYQPQVLNPNVNQEVAFREQVTISCEQFTKDYAPNSTYTTEAKDQYFTSNYKDKYVTWSGVVNSISGKTGSGSTAEVACSPGSNFLTILDLPESNDISKDDLIVFSGQISAYSATGVTLGDIVIKGHGDLSPVPQVVSTPTRFKIGDSIQLGDDVITVNNVVACKSTNQYSKPATGNKFVVVDITQENSGSEASKYNVLDFKLQDDQDFSYSYTFALCQTPAFASGTLSPGQKTRGYIAFEIPNDNTPTKLVFEPNMFLQDQAVIYLIK